MPSIVEPADYFTTNVDGTFNVLEAARHSGVRRLLYVASSTCYGVPDSYPTPEDAPIRPQFPYALTKHMGEELVLHWGRTYDLPVIVLRFFNVYGPRARTSGTYGAVFGVFLAQMLAGKPLTIVGDGTQTRDFTFVSDVVDAMVTAAASQIRGEVFNVGSGAPVSVNRLVELLKATETVHTPKRPGEPDCTFADMTRIRDALGWAPKVGIEEGVGIMLATSTTGGTRRCGRPRLSPQPRLNGSSTSANKLRRPICAAARGPYIHAMTNTGKTRAVVAMSGGVDSSVTAAMLVEQGFDVVGITLQLYDHGDAIGRKGACCAGQDIADARRVAHALGIPHYVLDFEHRFRDAVIDDFADTYLAGETPIPCVRCNQRVKFRDLMDVAKDLGANFLATGHYVRRVEGPDGPELHRARDGARDQSYFLFATTTEQLAFLRFPLGDLEKTEARLMARRLGLPVADKPDSQDICFVPQGSYADVIRRLRPEAGAPGDIVHVDGRVLGRHDGVVDYTVGQRRGLAVSWHEPLFVVRIEPAARRVVVGPRDALLGQTLTVSGVNWLAGGGVPTEGLDVDVKLRANQTAVGATLRGLGNGRAQVDLVAPQAAIAPGQACVVYRGPRVLGGGWIERPEAARAA